MGRNTNIQNCCCYYYRKYINKWTGKNSKRPSCFPCRKALHDEIIQTGTKVYLDLGTTLRFNIYNTTEAILKSLKASSRPSETSRRPSTEFGMQLCGRPRRRTTSAPTLSKSSKNLYDKATSAVLFNGSIGDWFQTTVGVRQG